MHSQRGETGPVYFADGQRTELGARPKGRVSDFAARHLLLHPTAVTPLPSRGHVITWDFSDDRLGKDISSLPMEGSRPEKEGEAVRDHHRQMDQGHCWGLRSLPLSWEKEHRGEDEEGHRQASGPQSR